MLKVPIKTVPKPERVLHYEIDGEAVDSERGYLKLFADPRMRQLVVHHGRLRAANSCDTAMNGMPLLIQQVSGKGMRAEDVHRALVITTGALYATREAVVGDVDGLRDAAYMIVGFCLAAIEQLRAEEKPGEKVQFKPGKVQLSLEDMKRAGEYAGMLTKDFKKAVRGGGKRK